MDNRKQQAQRLYMEGKTQKEISEIVGVSERTVHTWIHQYAWDKLRLAAYQAPATISDNLCSQLVELQNNIAAREPGKRFPSAEEAEVTRKLIASLEKMKKYPSLSQHMQVLETFRNYMRPIDKDFSRNLGDYTERFLNGKSINGFAPYQVEYGVNPVAPIDPYYDEMEDEATDTEKIIPCPDFNTCLHPGKCTYPHCQHPERYANKPDPASVYAVPPIQYEQRVHVETGSFPAIPTSENVQNTIIEVPEVMTLIPTPNSMTNSPAIPLMFLGSRVGSERSSDAGGGEGRLQPGWSTQPEETRSIPAIPQPENVENTIIPIPQLTPNPNPTAIKLHPKKQFHLLKKNKR